MEGETNHSSILNILWYFFDSLLLFICGISLVNLHLIISIVALLISIVYTIIKMSYFLKSKIKDNQQQKSNEKDINPLI